MSRRHKNSGFTLTELAISLTIMALLFVFLIPPGLAYIDNARRSAAKTRLALVDEALGRYVMKNRRLPCPADGTLGTANAASGREVRPSLGNCSADNQLNGVVPWVDLGLPAVDATDGWDNLITYRVSPALTADAALDMTACDAAGNEPGGAAATCTTGCTGSTLANCTPPYRFLLGKGLSILVDTVTAMDPAVGNGAAYVLISHGSNQQGAFTTGGQLLGTITTASGTHESANHNGVSLQAGYYDDNFAEAGGTGHFDDLLIRPSVFAVIQKAQLGPRVHP